MVLGNTGAAFFARMGTGGRGSVEDYSLWHPAECPHCSAGTPLENVATEG